MVDFVKNSAMLGTMVFIANSILEKKYTPDFGFLLQGYNLHLYMKQEHLYPKIFLMPSLSVSNLQKNAPNLGAPRVLNWPSFIGAPKMFWQIPHS